MKAIMWVVVFQLITTVCLLFFIWEVRDTVDDRFEALEKKLRDKKVL